jgi:hypothetical protein
MYPLSRWLNGPQSLSVVLEKGKKFTLARKWTPGLPSVAWSLQQISYPGCLCYVIRLKSFNILTSTLWMRACHSIDLALFYSYSRTYIKLRELLVGLLCGFPFISYIWIEFLERWCCRHPIFIFENPIFFHFIIFHNPVKTCLWPKADLSAEWIKIFRMERSRKQ